MDSLTVCRLFGGRRKVVFPVDWMDQTLAVWIHFGFLQLLWAGICDHVEAVHHHPHCLSPPQPYWDLTEHTLIDHICIRKLTFDFVLTNFFASFLWLKLNGLRGI